MAPPIQTGRRRSTTERRWMTRGAVGCPMAVAVIGSTPQAPQPVVPRTIAGVQQAAETDLDGSFSRICDTLSATRPTAVNLFWAIERMQRLYESLLKAD